MSALPNSSSQQSYLPIHSQPVLFSKFGVGVLTILLLLLLIVFQQLGVYLSAILLTRYGVDDTLDAPSSMSPSVDTLILWGSQNGTAVSLSFLFTLFTMLGFILMVVRWRIKKTSSTSAYSTRHFLALRGFDWHTAVKILMLFILYSLIAELSLYLLDKDSTAFLDDIYATADPKWLLILAIVVVAPIYEELMFRGVLWAGLRQHLTGQTGFWLTNLITSGLFAIIHVQYDVVELGVLLIFALLLGYTRERSDSLLLSILLHTLNNALAMGLYLYLS